MNLKNNRKAAARTGGRQQGGMGMIGGLGMQELLVILLVLLLLFGAKRLPEIGKAMGQGIKQFKKATKEIEAEVNLEEDDKVTG
jgi:sec-independent protein translocase protein TatA